VDVPYYQSMNFDRVTICW